MPKALEPVPTGLDASYGYRPTRTLANPLAVPLEVWEAADRLDQLAPSRGSGVSNADHGVRKNAFMRVARDDLGKPPEASYPTEPR